MSDTITHLGTTSIGACIPGAMASISIAQGELEARIAAMASWSPGAINIGAQIALAEQILADLQLGVSPPSIGAQIAIMAAILAGLRAQLAVIMAFYDLCAKAGVDAYWYDGSAAGFGAAVASVTAAGLPSGGTGATHCDALVLAATASATAGAMRAVFISP